MTMAERLIDAEALTQSISKGLVGLRAYEGRRMVEIVADCIINAPTIEAKPIVHAHWVDVNPNLHIGMKCSLCGARIKYSEFFNGNHRYCHKCGAQMDEGVKIPVISMEDVPKIMEEMENES
jgi:hypothetical protein